MKRLLPILLVLALLGGACSGGGDGGDDDGAAPAEDSTTTESTAQLHSDEELEDGRHFGQVTALDPAQHRMVFDVAELDDGVVDNPEDAMVRLTISDDIEVQLLDPCCELSDASFESWLDGFNPDERSFYTTSLSYYWITLEGGEVVAVEEQFIEQ